MPTEMPACTGGVKGSLDVAGTGGGRAERPAAVGRDAAGALNAEDAAGVGVDGEVSSSVTSWRRRDASR